ncbi:MAG: chemotaxis protein CheX [Oscillospiraceae bacterium]|nr:chemotaxis protein CheX [Oscillospiraceae bacterium]
MFTQFFGSYLLNQKIVSGETLKTALEDKKNTKTRLGVLAINAGLMTAEQVEQVHQAQATSDKRIGDLAVDMGFLKSQDVERLLSSQPTDYLVLGQALVNNGALTNAQFEKALKDYKAAHALSEYSEEDIKNDVDNVLARITIDFYDLGNKESEDIYIYYLDLVFKNLIRFVGDDFLPLPAKVVSTVKVNHMAFQDISGVMNYQTGIEADDDAYKIFASRYAKEELTEVDDFTDAAVGEFLNLSNGLFVVNLSNRSGIELDLTPQKYVSNDTVKYEKDALFIPIMFTFGVVNFIISL